VVNKPQITVAAVAAWTALLCATASAFNISLVYPGGTLFSTTHDPLAMASINQAAADISAAITSNLGAINTDVYTGNTNGSTVQHNFRFSYGDPLIDGNQIDIQSATTPANTVTIHVGARSIFGATLGEGGPAGIGVNTGFSYFDANHLPSAAASANSQASSAYKRGGGPVVGTLSGSSVIAGVTVNTSVQYGVSYGALSFDWDGDDNGAKDSNTALNNYWHFNHTTNPVSGKNDLYSVALHEILHALGIGSSQTWDEKVSGTNWSGTNVAGLMGSGAGLINANGDHIATDIFSTRWYDGEPQEAAMDPNITEGERKYLTALDLAFLRDIGYSTVDWVTSPSSPADFDNDGKVDAADLAMWQGGYGINANGDADSDGDTDGHDFLVWQREHTSPAPFTTMVAVPEPSTFALIALCGMSLLCRHRGTR
jgi:hypothetical protein